MADKKEKGKISEENAYAQMARSCSRKEYTPFDIIRKLRRMDLSEEAIEKVVVRLKKGKYIDERRFIRSYIHDKLHFNRWGKKKIILFLRQKELPQGMIDEILLEFSSDSFNESLLSLLEKKKQSVKGKSNYEKRGKLIRYALGRGFSMEETMACMRKMDMEESFDEME